MWKRVMVAVAAVACTSCVIGEPIYRYESPTIEQPSGTITLKTVPHENGSMFQSLMFVLTPQDYDPAFDADYRRIHLNERARIHVDTPLHLVARSTPVPGLDCRNGVSFTPQASKTYVVRQSLDDRVRCRTMILDESTGEPVSDAVSWSPPRFGTPLLN